MRRTLDSVAAQTFRPLKLILVDNNSTDNSLHTLLDWKKETENDDFEIKVIEEKTPGASAARNAALNIIDTDWTLFFDSDDIMPLDHIEKIMAAINESPEVNILGWSRKIHFLNGKIVVKNFSLKYPEFNNLSQSIFATQGYAARTEIFRKAGGWDETLSVADDIELGSRLLKLHPSMSIISGHAVDVYESVKSITNSSNMKSMCNALDKIRGTFPENKQHLIDLQLIIQAASWGKTDPESAGIAKNVIKNTPWPRRWLWKFFYWYQLHGGRGVARIYALTHSSDIKIHSEKGL